MTRGVAGRLREIRIDPTTDVTYKLSEAAHRML